MTRRFDTWHLAGALAGGVLIGWTSGALGGREPLSAWEARHLEPIITDSLVTQGRRFVGPYACSDDCSGHLAGYAWARESGAAREEICEGNESNSFSEGCRYYLQVVGRLTDEP